MNPAHVDLASLRVFVAVAQSGSMSEGAERSNLTLGAVSKRITELEQLSGSALFRRLPTGVRLTPAGLALMHEAIAVIEAVERMTARMDEFATGLGGQVHVSATSSAIILGLPYQLQAFCREHPNVRLELEEKLSSDVISDVQNRRADIGIFASNVPHEGLIVQPFGVDELTLIASPDHPLASRNSISLHEILPYELIAQHSSSSIAGMLGLAPEAHGGAFRLHMRMRSYDAVCRMVAAGLGLGLVPISYSIPREILDQIRAVPILDSNARRALVTGVRSVNALPAIAKALRRYLLLNSSDTKNDD